MARRIRADLALGLAPALAARRHPDAWIELDHDLALFPEAGRRLSFPIFADLVERAAGRLAAAGIDAGRRVLIVAEPSFDVPLLAFAAARLGVIPVLVHPSVGATDLGVLLERAQPAALITDHATLALAVAAAAGAAASVSVFVAGAAASGPIGFDGAGADVALLPVTHRPLPAAPTPVPDAEQLVTHTSGTTGVPKLVVQTAATFDGQCRPQAVIGRLLGIKDPYLLCISPMHVRTLAAITSSLANGVPMGFMVDTSPDNAARMLARVRPVAVETVPNAFVRWEQIADEQPDLLDSVRIYLSTFDAAHPRTIRTFLERGRRRARYIQVYGQSETGPVAMKFYRLRRSGALSRRCVHSRCVGKPLAFQSAVRIDAEANSPGPILARTHAVTPAYLGTPDQRVDGWWPMGDFGVVSERGCLHLLDRIVDRDDSGIESLLALEDVILERIPELTEAVLIPITGSLPIPLICTRADRALRSERWWQAVDDLPDLAPPMLCRWDDIPHTATWKVRRPQAAKAVLAGSLGAAERALAEQHAAAEFDRLDEHVQHLVDEGRYS